VKGLTGDQIGITKLLKYNKNNNREKWEDNNNLVVAVVVFKKIIK